MTGLSVPLSRLSAELQRALVQILEALVDDPST
jgi:hypothetical protein